MQQCYEFDTIYRLNDNTVSPQKDGWFCFIEAT